MWLLFFVAVAIAIVAYRAATTTTVVLVRHAEKELVTINDPPLAPAVSGAQSDWRRCSVAFAGQGASKAFT